MQIQWFDELADAEVTLSNQFFEQEKVLPKRGIFQYGQWKKEIKFFIKEDFPPDVIGLSKAMQEQLTLPGQISFQLKWDGRNLELGPLIAFLVGSKDKYLRDKLDRYKPYFEIYPQFKGLIYICPIDGVNTQNKTIEGYYYDYKTENKWQKGIFPYPGALYRKTGFNSKLYNEFIQELGDRFFNTFFFNKWDLWDWLSQNKECRVLLPYTEKLKDHHQLEAMMNEYDEVYIKQINGQKAKGIIKVYKKDDKLCFEYRLKGTVSFQTQNELEEFIKTINVKNDYLVQQAIPVKLHDDRRFDFRMIMQKNALGKWGCTTSIARFGKKHSIATNFLLDGYALPGVEALITVFGLKEREAFIKEQEMIRACTQICEALDRCGGNYGDVGIDVVVDEKQKIWILEVNKLHDHKFPLYALDDSQTYYVVTTPFQYAAYLAGFQWLGGEI